MVAKRNQEWQAEVKGLLRAELTSRGLTYADLANKLIGLGVKADRRNLSNKIARGSFSAVFFLQCLRAIGCQTLHLSNG